MEQSGNLTAVCVPGTPAASVVRADDFLSELLRELELIRLGGGVGGSESHAGVLALLTGIQSLLHRCSRAREHVRAQAEAALREGADTFDARLHVDADAAHTTRRLRDLVCKAIVCCERDLLLTVPPPRDVAAFLRVWLQAVVNQLSTGAEPPVSRWTWNADVDLSHRLEVPQPEADQATGDDGVAVNGTMRVRLRPTLAASRRARQLLRHAEDRFGLPDLLEAAALPLSELVTNAVLHARSDIEVAVCLNQEALRVEVHDERPDLHGAASRDLESTTGRGLELVGAIADRWGVIRRDDGKVVWFELEA